MTKLFWRK